MHRYEDRITIPTPEGIELQLTLAGLGSRFTAALIDGLIRVAVIVAGAIALGLSAALIGDFGARGNSIASQTSVAIATISLFLLLFGYDVAFETLASGRTPGKRAAGLRVIRVEGGPVTFAASAIRNILRLVDWLPFGFAAGAAAVLLSGRNQRIGDMAAGTIVVRERIEVRQESADRLTGSEVDLTHWDVSGITALELSAVRSFLARRADLTPSARAELASDLERGLRPKVAGAPEPMEPEEFLEHLAIAKAARS